jgi:hypothetical protein
MNVNDNIHKILNLDNILGVDDKEAFLTADSLLENALNLLSDAEWSNYNGFYSKHSCQHAC